VFLVEMPEHVAYNH